MNQITNNLQKLQDEIEVLQKQIRDYQNLHRIFQIICSSLQVNEILKNIIDEAIRLCGCDQGSIMVFDPAGRQAIKTLIRQGKGEGEPLDHYLNSLLAGWVSRHKKSLLTHDLIKTFGSRQIHKKYFKISSVLSEPLGLRDKIIGVINLVHLNQQKKFSQRESHLMQILASQCAQFITNAKLHEELFTEMIRLRREVEDKYAPYGIIGQSPKMQEVFAFVDRVIPTEGRVLLEGESGTGEELIARVLHYNGPRKDGPFVAVDCGALPTNLLESELFGYVKGAFTGAQRDKKGLFEEADWRHPLLR